MKASQADSHSAEHAAEQAASSETVPPASSGPSNDTISTVAAVGIVGIAAALFEASLIPGIILGVAAVAAPKYAGRVTEGLRPMFSSAVKGCSKLAMKGRSAFAEAQEHVQDLMAEARSETADSASKATAGSDTATPA